VLHWDVARQFTNENIPDDDNFIMRWVINHGWDVKIQYSKEATITTILGGFPLKLHSQCTRWSRTAFRQNPNALFVDRTIWFKWPLPVWTTYMPLLYNATLIWDGLAIYTQSQTQLYTTSLHRTAIMCSLIGFIWLTKVVKTVPWCWAYPMEFLLYFVIPAYLLFVYCHSLLKIDTLFTCWNLKWSGQNLK
jgi:hypothetical protein